MQKTTAQEGLPDSGLTVLDLAVLRGDIQLVTNICANISKHKESKTKEGKKKLTDIIDDSKKYLNKSKSEVLSLLRGNWQKFNNENINPGREDIKNILDSQVTPSPSPNTKREEILLDQFLKESGNEDFKIISSETDEVYVNRINSLDKVKNQAKPQYYCGIGIEVDLIFDKNEDGSENLNKITGFNVKKVFDESPAAALGIEAGKDLILNNAIEKTDETPFIGQNGVINNENLISAVQKIRNGDLSNIKDIGSDKKINPKAIWDSMIYDIPVKKSTVSDYEVARRNNKERQLKKCLSNSLP